jgi:hypothetical protein
LYFINKLILITICIIRNDSGRLYNESREQCERDIVFAVILLELN